MLCPWIIKQAELIPRKVSTNIAEGEVQGPWM